MVGNFSEHAPQLMFLFTTSPQPSSRNVGNVALHGMNND